MGITLAKVGAFILLMLVVGRRVFPRLLFAVAGTGSRELFTLCVVTVAIGVAYGSALLFDVSFALGAFFAGMMMRESAYSHRAADESLPLRDAFAVLFFVSVGMLFDPQVIVREPLKVLAVVAVIIFGKTAAAMGLVLAFRYPLNTALTVGASLAQIGEFSFILAGLGVSLGLLPMEGQSLILAGALISIALNSLLFAAIDPVKAWILRRSDWARRMELRDDPLAELPTDTDETKLRGQVVLVGYGRVGKRLVESLIAQQVPLVVAEQQRELVDALRRQGIAAVSGDASDPAVLIQGPYRPGFDADRDRRRQRAGPGHGQHRAAAQSGPARAAARQQRGRGEAAARVATGRGVRRRAEPGRTAIARSDGVDEAGRGGRASCVISSPPNRSRRWPKRCGRRRWTRWSGSRTCSAKASPCAWPSSRAARIR